MPIHFAALQWQSLQVEQYVKRQLVSLGLNEFGVRGDDPTPTASVTGGSARKLKPKTTTRTKSNFKT